PEVVPGRERVQREAVVGFGRSSQEYERPLALLGGVLLSEAEGLFVLLLRLAALLHRTSSADSSISVHIAILGESLQRQRRGSLDRPQDPLPVWQRPRQESR